SRSWLGHNLGRLIWYLHRLEKRRSMLHTNCLGRLYGLRRLAARLCRSCRASPRSNASRLSYRCVEELTASFAVISTRSGRSRGEFRRARRVLLVSPRLLALPRRGRSVATGHLNNRARV